MESAVCESCFAPWQLGEEQRRQQHAAAHTLGLVGARSSELLGAAVGAVSAASAGAARYLVNGAVAGASSAWRGVRMQEGPPRIEVSMPRPAAAMRRPAWGCLGAGRRCSGGGRGSAALIGAGGGFVVVPALTLSGVPVSQAVGSALLVKPCVEQGRDSVSVYLPGG